MCFHETKHSIEYCSWLYVTLSRVKALVMIDTSNSLSYRYQCELQRIGTPHFHMLIWTNDRNQQYQNEFRVPRNLFQRFYYHCQFCVIEMFYQNGIITIIVFKTNRSGNRSVNLIML